LIRLCKVTAGRKKIFFSASKSLHLLWGPPSHLTMATGETFYGSEATGV